MHSPNAVNGALIETVTVLLTLEYTTKSLGGIFNTQIAELHSQFLTQSELGQKKSVSLTIS